jgi:hypothetical protein
MRWYRRARQRHLSDDSLQTIARGERGIPRRGHRHWGIIEFRPPRSWEMFTQEELMTKMVQSLGQGMEI